MMYDLIIVGGGPGGVAAGVYAARKKMKTLLITDIFGGQSLISAGIENWIGTKVISGYDLGKALEEHLRAQKDIEIVDGDLVTTVEKKSGGFSISTKNGKTFETKYLLLTSGSRHKKLGVPGEREFDGKGIVYCATCDAPIFEHKTVAVVGGANSALEAVMDLIPYASKIYLMVRGEVLKGDPVTQDKLKNHEQVKIMFNVGVESVSGNEFVTGLRYKDLKTNEVKELALDGVFVEIGLMPNSDFVKDLVQVDAYGAIVTNPKTQETSCPGVWAAGDVTDVLYRQNNISVGDAVKAVLNIYDRAKKE
jgi:alkyl hydroperoxide reductase subunit F